MNTNKEIKEGNASGGGLDYGSAPVARLFRKIFFPTLLGMIFTALITIVDGVFVGRSVGPDGIAAVNIIAPLYMVNTGIGLMLGIGASVVGGIALASSDSRRASLVVSQSFGVGTLVSVMIASASLLFPRHVALMLGSSEHLMGNAQDYLCWLMPGMVFLTWSSIGMMVIRLDGSPKYAMMINVVPAVLNIVGDYILIFPMGMGVKGAALATSTSIIVGGLMTMAYFRSPYIIRLVASTRSLMRNVVRVMAIGSSAFVTEIAMSVMMITGNYVFMSYFGDSGVAAYSIACYLFPIIFMMSNAVAQSAQPIISYNVGRRAVGRVRETLRLSVGVALLCGMISFGLISLLSPLIVELFIPAGSEAGRLAIKGLPIYSSCAVMFAVNIAYIGYYQSIDMPLRAMLLTLLRGVIILVPAFFVVPILLPEIGCWAAIPVSEAITLIVILLSYRRFEPSGVPNGL